MNQYLLPALFNKDFDVARVLVDNNIGLNEIWNDIQSNDYNRSVLETILVIDRRYPQNNSIPEDLVLAILNKIHVSRSLRDVDLVVPRVLKLVLEHPRTAHLVHTIDCLPYQSTESSLLCIQHGLNVYRGAPYMRSQLGYADYMRKLDPLRENWYQRIIGTVALIQLMKTYPKDLVKYIKTFLFFTK